MGFSYFNGVVLSVATALVGFAVYTHNQNMDREHALNTKLTNLQHAMQEQADGSQKMTAQQEANLRVWKTSALSNRSPSQEAGDEEAADATEEPGSTHVEAMEEPSIEDQDSFLQVHFDQQAPDPTWSRQTEAHLARAIGTHLATERLSSLECRSDLCRAEIEYESQQEYDQLIQNSRAIWDGETQLLRISSSEDGSITQHVYFAKIGSTLPSLD